MRAPTTRELASETSAPFYRPLGDEVAVFEHCHRAGLPVLLKGPTGCGKTRFVEHLAARLGRELVTVACHDDSSAADLLGRHLVLDGDTRWCDGPALRALRGGAILYLDEIAEARPDVLAVLHPLADHRRTLFVDRLGVAVAAGPGFHLVASYNPGYQRGMKELKPSTRQRFVALEFHHPDERTEAEILTGETGVETATAKRLAKLGAKLRSLEQLGLGDAVSTRLLVDAAVLIAGGLDPRQACWSAIVAPLTDDPDVGSAARDLAALAF